MIRLVWPDHVELFLRETKAYEVDPDVFAPFYALAEEDDAVIGFAQLMESVMSTALLAITWVAVHPDHQGKGIGRKMVAVCMEEARRRGRPVIFTTDVPEFYEKLGFHRLGQCNPARNHYVMTGGTAG